MKLLIRKFLFACVIAVLLIGLTSYSLSAVGKTTQPEISGMSGDLHQHLTPNSNFVLTQQQRQWQRLRVSRKPRSQNSWLRGMWVRLNGLGRRGSCSNLNPPLIAFIPPPADEESREILATGLESALSLTLSAYPTFWFYVPEQLREIELVEFMMQDDKGEDVFENPLRVRLKTSGIVSFELPSREDQLEINKPYHWYFSVICDSDRPSRNPSIDGWIERVQLKTSREELAAATPKERLEFYASQDIWHETLKLLAEQRCRDRQNPLYADYWDAILQSVVRDIDRDKIDPLSYCSSQQQLAAVYHDLNVLDLED